MNEYDQFIETLTRVKTLNYEMNDFLYHFTNTDFIRRSISNLTGQILMDKFCLDNLMCGNIIPYANIIQLHNMSILLDSYQNQIKMYSEYNSNILVVYNSYTNNLHYSFIEDPWRINENLSFIPYIYNNKIIYRKKNGEFLSDLNLDINEWTEEKYIVEKLSM